MGNINKVIAIKIKPQNSNEYVEVPITTLAEYVYWGTEKDSDFDLKQHIIGNIKTNNNTPVPLQNQIDNLNSDKANINSPNFTGTPTIEDGLEHHDVNTEIATKGYINNQITGQLKRSNLKDPQILPENSQITNMENRQYSVVLDGEGKLSVNVPWENTEYSQIKNIWSGKCETNVSDSRKIIILDDLESFQDQLIENNPNIILAIYFEKGNTANNPKLIINNQQYDVQIDISNFSNSVNPGFVSSPGLKFFIYKKENNEEKFLLSTIDYLTLINNLNNSKANINSPNFSGYPKINDASIATVNYVDNKTDNQLTTSYLQKSDGTIAATAAQVPENIPSNKTYPVVFDANNKLSVVVPWVDADATIENIQRIWTGFCSEGQNTIKKTIVLDNKGNNFGQLFSIIEDEPPTITPGSTLLIYFRNGNEVTSPIIEIEDAPVEIAQKPILYQSSSSSFSEIDSQILCQWGPGLKIFTYVTYDNNTKDGWVINSFDGLIIQNLNNRLTTVESNINKKANINSPQFTGIPITNTPNKNNLIQNQITNVEYVKNECKEILNPNENYAFRLKDNNNREIFTVDWDGNANLVGTANEINLNCFSTTEILKSQFNDDNSKNYSTIIGKYNKVTYTTEGLKCGEDKKCSENLLVGGEWNRYHSGNSAFVIGNGSDDRNRSNAFEISWGGDIHMPSRIYIDRPDVQLGSLPSSNYGGNALILRDKNQKSMGIIGYWYGTDNWSGIAIAAERNSTFNTLRLLKNNTGQAKVYVTHPSAWRNALGLNNILKLVEFTTVKVSNITINANDFKSVTTSYTPPSGYSAQIMNVVFSNATNGRNCTWCFCVDNWFNAGTLYATIRNTASTSAIINCTWRMLLKRTVL